MKCIILASNSKSRVYPVTNEMPKALLPIRGRPVISHILSKVQLTECINEAFIVSNQRFFNQFKEWLDNFPATIATKIISDGTLNGKDSLGAVKTLDFVINSYNLADDLLVIGGDNLFSFSLDEFIGHSLRLSPNPLIGIYRQNGRVKPKRFGVVILDSEGRVIDFYEKPPQHDSSYPISLCIYYFPKETLYLIKEYLSAFGNNGSIGNYIKWLVKKSQVYSFNFQGDWFDMDDVDSYAEAVCLF